MIDYGYVACGYCGTKLIAVAHIYPNAKPACGSASCLQQALRDHEQAKEEQ